MKNAVTVSQINRYIKNLFVRDHALSCICVKGEVSNCTYHSSGHIYFTLKDASSALSCVMFASQRKKLDFVLKEGAAVIVQGSIGVFEKGGRYQLYAEEISKDGVGRLYEEYERLKRQLEEEGLFDAERKKTIPKYPAKIGVVTAKTGAVIQDICNVSFRRNPYVQLYLYPAQVQGEGAAYSIIQGIHYFDESDVDTVIVGRGGGSIEDLWAFNEEELVRAVAACKKPIISAVGHETDTTLCDYAADLRAPTPSAAAELAVYAWRDFEIGLREMAYDFRQQMQHTIQSKRMELERRTLQIQHASPRDVLQQRQLYLAQCQEQLQNIMERRLVAAKHQLALYIEELKGLSPLYKLTGGYSYTTDTEGKPVESVKQIKPEQQLWLTFKDGRARVKVMDCKEEEQYAEKDFD